MFEKHKVSIYTGSTLIAEGHHVQGLYYLVTAVEQLMKLDNALVSDLSLWHARMAHVNMDGIKQMPRNGVLSGSKVDMVQKLEICESCVVSRTTCAATPKQGGDRAKHPLDLVQLDVSGQFQLGSLGGSR